MAILKSEADFQSKMLDHIKKKWWIWFKIADSDCRLKMADCVVTYRGQTFWLELKYRGEKHYPNILLHQENSCKRVWDAGGKYFFIEYDARFPRLKILTGFVPAIHGINEREALAMVWLEDFI